MSNAKTRLGLTAIPDTIANRVNGARSSVTKMRIPLQRETGVRIRAISSKESACTSQVGIDILETEPPLGMDRVEATTLALGKEPPYILRAWIRSTLGMAGIVPSVVAGLPQTGHLSGNAALRPSIVIN